MTENKPHHIPWDLIIQYFKGECSTQTHQALMQWAEQPGHRALLEELQALWDKIQTRSADYTPDEAYYWNELTRRLKLHEPTGKRHTTARSMPLSQILLRVAVAACLLLAVGAAYYLGAGRGANDSAVEQVYRCLSGKSCISLPDGTRVWLHGQTTLSCGAHFLQGERSVKLSGEAYFEVARGGQKPFVVQTDGLQVAVHGTKFNVEAPDGASESRIALLEGSISLRTPSQCIFLQPGERAIYDRKLQHLKVEAEANLLYDALWIRERISLTDATLGQVCRYLSKWYRVKIHVDESLNDNGRFTFTLRNEPLEEVLKLMSRIHPIAYRFDAPDEVTITQKR